jgi:hypothetical protein
MKWAGILRFLQMNNMHCILQANGEEYRFTLNPTSGPYPRGKNFILDKQPTGI